MVAQACLAHSHVMDSLGSDVCYVGSKVIGLNFVRNPLRVFRMVRVFLAKLIPGGFPRAVLVSVVKFPSKSGGFICSHDSKSGP